MALTASDSFNEVVMADIGEYNDPLTQDIERFPIAVQRLHRTGVESVFNKQ